MAPMKRPATSDAGASNKKAKAKQCKDWVLRNRTRSADGPPGSTMDAELLSKMSEDNERLKREVSALKELHEREKKNLQAQVQNERSVAELEAQSVRAKVQDLEKMKMQMVQLTRKLDDEVSAKDQVIGETHRLERKLQELSLGATTAATSSTLDASQERCADMSIVFGPVDTIIAQTGRNPCHEKHLKLAILASNKVSMKLMRVVDQWMKYKDIQQVLLRNAAINDVAFGTLAQALVDCPSMQTLDLSQNLLTMDEHFHDSCSDLCQLITTAPSLSFMSLAENLFSLRCVGYFMTAVMERQTTKRLVPLDLLDLQGNEGLQMALAAVPPQETGVVSDELPEDIVTRLREVAKAPSALNLLSTTAAVELAAHVSRALWRFLQDTQHPQLRGSGDEVDFDSFDKATLHKMDNSLLKILLLPADENRENSRPLTANAVLLPALARQARCDRCGIALEEEDEIQRYQGELTKEPVVTMDDLYAKEAGQSDRHRDRLHELKIRMAVEAYEQRRPADTYFPTGDERDGVPIYRNQHGLVLSREAHRADSYSWVIGCLADRRPLYGVRSDDLSAPTLGWQAFTAPEPVPVIRYYTKVTAARTFKERGNRAFHQRNWKDAESWYSQALKCGMDEEHAEPYALLFSNRSEARMKLQDFRGAAEDGDEALKYLKSISALGRTSSWWVVVGGSLGDEGQALRRKTVLRLGRALQAMNRMSEAMRLLHHERRNYPECQEMQRMAESTRLALRSLGRGTPAQSRGEREEQGMDSVHGRKLMEYVAMISEALQKEINSLKKGQLYWEIWECHNESMKTVLEDLQALLQTNGVLRYLLNMLEAQWRMNMDGRFVDLFKLPGAFAVASVTALICEKNEANLRFVASEALCLWALLGGCNCKVQKEVCERLVSLVHGLWELCRPQTLDLIQSNSVVVERAAFYLASALQSSPEDDPVFGPDSPPVSLECKEQAALLLLDLLALGGRLKRRCLRGLMPQLGGFFQSSQPAVRTLGELVAKNAVDDPQLVDQAQAPELGEHALRALSTMAQTYLENVETIISCGALEAETLQMPAARRYASRLLMQCTASKEFMKVIQDNSERCVQELVKLGIQLWDDGISSAESFQDVMHVFHAIASHRPDILSTNLREAEMLQLLLRLEKSNVPDLTPLAAEILKILRKDRNFKRIFAPVKRLYEEGYDPELELKLRQTATALPMRTGKREAQPEQVQVSDPFADLKSAFEPAKEMAKTFNLKQIVTRTGTVLMNMLERLLETTDIDAVDVESDMTLLEFACTSGNLGLAKLCYRRGAKLMAISKRGETAFNIVTRNRRYDIMEFLHIYGDVREYTAMAHAEANNHFKLMDRLVALGAKGHGLHHSSDLAKSKSTTSMGGNTTVAVSAGMLKSHSVPSQRCENLANCLGDFKEERHEFQAKVAGMAQEVLASIKAKFEADIAKAEETLAKADAEKATREAAVEETTWYQRFAGEQIAVCF
eukprot:g16907.t1